MSNSTSDHALAARMIRNHLRANGLTVKCRSKIFSGGTSIDVHVHNDVLPAARKEIEVFCQQFKYGHFDGMTDCYNYDNHRDDLPQVKYLSVHFHYSEEVKAEALKYVEAIEGIHPSDRSHYVWKVLAEGGMWGEAFWRNRKPRVRAAA